MARIVLAIGLSSARADAALSLVYLGRSAEEMRQAVAKATQPRLLLVPFVTGIPKSNPNAAANSEREAAELVAQVAEVEASDTALDAEIQRLNARVAELEESLSEALGQLSPKPDVDPSPPPAADTSPSGKKPRRGE